MSKTQAIKEIKAIVGMTARATGNGKEIRVAVKLSGEASAYYTDDADDALATAKVMAKQWNA